MQQSLLADMDRTSHDPALCRKLLDHLSALLQGRSLRFMEVCGTHTVSIFQSGLRSLLPANITHLSGPGCPVCVTHEEELATLMVLAEIPDLVLATFGDLLRVPGPSGKTLKHFRASGSDIRIVYSPLDALNLARSMPTREVVFAGIGFETTAPAVAAAILTARKEHIKNFSVLSFHKLVMPALESLIAENANIDAFLLPGHVATITGLSPFLPLAFKYGKPAAIGGFEPTDILMALIKIAEMPDKPDIRNAYPRAVAADGNPTARKIMADVFEICDAKWRGLGPIPDSGLKIKWDQYDALRKFSPRVPPAPAPAGCKCGEILKGLLQPPQCPLFGRACSPQSPIGPCMVSTEGSCAAWYKYGELPS